MRRIEHSTLAAALPGILLVNACGLPVSGVVTYTAYQLTCCTKSDIEQVWRPGTEVDLHWGVEAASRTTVNPTHNVVTTATLQSPYSHVTTLKQSSGATNVVQGSVIKMDDPTALPVAPVTIFLLPVDLPPGYYRWDLKTDFGDGGFESSGSVVRVGRQ